MGLPFFGTTNKVLVGWNQLLKLNGIAVKVTSFNVGIKQDPELPDLVIGGSDRLAFQKGVISVEGNISAPMTNRLSDIFLDAIDNIPHGGGSIVLESSALPGGLTFETYINQLTITAEAGEPINVSADFYGRIFDTGNGMSPEDFSSGKGTLTNGEIGEMDGDTSWDGDYSPEQIPMFDRIVIDTGFLPLDESRMGSPGNFLVPIGLTFTVNNNLNRNYVLSVGDANSSGDVGSLNAFSINRGQRLLSGSMKFQSGYTSSNAKLAIIMNSGRSGGSANSGFAIYGSSVDGTYNGTKILHVDGSKFFPVWSAAPPTVGTDRLTYEAEFKMVAKQPGIWPIKG